MRNVGRLQTEKEYLQSELKQLHSRTRAEAEKLKARIAELGDSDVDSNIRFGRAELLLGRTWVENQHLRRELAIAKGQEAPAEEPNQPAESPVTNNRLTENASRFLYQLCETYAGRVPPRDLSGKELWDECGRSVLSAILTRDEPLRFRTAGRPKISIVLVLRNKAHLSILALCALLLDASDYEVIVVDNASSDETRAILARIEGVRVIRNAVNCGFGPAVMQASMAASGEFLCLLNNDALLQPGALARAVATFGEVPHTGVVGGKVLLANGRLQEAGCIIWRDGRPMQYGRGADPGLPQYNFQRPVDYCSGVFLVTPVELFLDLGGLDRLYATAYYEDADYCMKVWHDGKTVIYEPRCVVQHYEAASSPNQLAALDLFIPNHHTFTEKWRHALHLHQVEKPSNVVKARIAAFSETSLHLYIVNATDIAMLQAKLGGNRNPSNQCSVATTVLFVGDLNPIAYENGFSVGVELRDVGGMVPGEIEAYCSASDAITVMAERSSIQGMLSLLEAHADKVTFLNNSLGLPRL
jgi:GT2 family glycosyltransferase